MMNERSNVKVAWIGFASALAAAVTTGLFSLHQKSQIIIIENELHAASTNLDAEKKAKAEIENELQDLQAKLTNSNVELRQAKLDLTAIKEQSRATEAKIEQKRQEFEKYEKRLKDLNQKYRELSQLVDSAKNEVLAVSIESGLKETKELLSKANLDKNKEQSARVRQGRITSLFTYGKTPPGMKQLGDLEQNAHWVEKDGLLLTDDFFVEFQADIAKQFGSFSVTLVGDNGGSNLEMTFEMYNPFSDGSNWRVRTPEGTQNVSPSRGNRTFRLTRKGQLFSLTCDSARVGGKHEANVAVSRFPLRDAKSFEALKLGVDKSSFIRGLRFGPIR